MKCRIATQRKLEKQRNSASKKMSPVMISSMLMVCEKRLHYGYDKMRDVTREISGMFDSINWKYVDFQDLKDCLLEENNVEIPFDLSTKQRCVTIDDSVKIAEYTQKAFACAVLCTVFTDKFLYGTKKTQQAVKQVCNIFDELKGNHKMQKEYEQHLRDAFQIGLHEKED